MLNYKRYKRVPVVDFKERTWPNKEIEKAPIWCSVDLRDGNQALIEPMVVEEKIEFFNLLVKLGFKEIEIGFPAASETEYELCRTLIEKNMIPDDVTIQVLTQARPHIIKKTFEAVKGAPRAIVHVYNSTSLAQREQVFRKSKEEIKQIAIEGAKLLKELAEAEMLEAKEKLPGLEEEIKILLLPKDKDDDKNVICEIRGGAGGDEAALFAGTLFRMYSMYAERKHWKLEVLNENETELGGYKEISFMITGKGAYSRLKFESGVHRVQRVPDTEASGRIHTSTATVAVLPVVEDVEIDINPADIRMEVFRSSGAGGQHINKTSSAVRLIHEPTGIVVECQTERSQFQNKDNAMKMLKTKLYDIEKQKQDSEISNARKSQVGSGDRSEKIRTYNYPQGRITDHRIGFSIYQMEDFLNGNLDEMIDNLITADRAEKLKGNDEE